MIVYLNGRYIPSEDASISVNDRGFIFGDGVYEVITSYKGKPFRAEQHVTRLERSLREIKIVFPDLGRLLYVCEELIRHNRLEQENSMTYIQITRGVAPRKHTFPDGNTPPTVYMFTSPFESRDEQCDAGVKVILLPDLRWGRCDIKSISLLANILARQEAKEQGAEEALLFRDGYITEGSHSSFCAVFNGTLQTHPKTSSILPGITRDVILELCDSLNIPCREEPISVDMIRNADECMLLGSGSEIMPVVQINDATVGNGAPGPITEKLQKAFSAIHQ